MSTIASGWLTGFFLCDVAEAIDIDAVSRQIASTTSARMAPKPPAPSYIQYAHPPLTIDGRAVDMPMLGEWQVRFKAFDYGVLSLALTQPIPETWDAVLEIGLRWHEDTQLPATAEQFCRTLVERLGPALSRPRAEFLSEDYLVFTATELSDVGSADAFIAAHGGHLAQLLRAERDRLSTQEREEVLRHRISYLTTDLVIPTWNEAFVCDSEVGAHGVLEILEFANSQLLEFRYYDRLLDKELERIYPRLQLVAELVRAPVHARGAAGSLPLHRCQRAYGQDRKRPEDCRGRVCRSSLHAGGGAARPRPVEGKRLR